MSELLIASRAIHLGACLVLLAVFAVRLLVERPAAGAPGGRGLAFGCLGAAMGSGFLWLWASVAGMSGSSLMDALDRQLFAIVIEQTPPGRVWVIRCVLGLLLGVALCFARRRWVWWIAGLIATAFTGSIAWLGHAGASEDGRRVVMLIADVAHLMAVSMWPAGLVPFALLLRRRATAGEWLAAHGDARRFSAMSLAAVSVIAASGFVNSYFLVGSIHALTATGYGRVLSVKLCLFAAAASLGMWNLFVHEPRMAAEPTALEAMRRKVWIEVGLGALIVFAVAILGTLAPGSAPAG